VAQKRNPIELRKLSEDSNPRLKELLEDITDHAKSDKPRPLKASWGRRFNASGKNKGGAPRIRLSYQEG
jgi:hypothetical protein